MAAIAAVQFSGEGWAIWRASRYGVTPGFAQPCSTPLCGGRGWAGRRMAARGLRGAEAEPANSAAAAIRARLSGRVEGGDRIALIPSPRRPAGDDATRPMVERHSWGKRRPSPVAADTSFRPVRQARGQDRPNGRPSYNGHRTRLVRRRHDLDTVEILRNRPDLWPTPHYEGCLLW